MKTAQYLIEIGLALATTINLLFELHWFNSGKKKSRSDLNIQVLLSAMWIALALTSTLRYLKEGFPWQ